MAFHLPRKVMLPSNHSRISFVMAMFLRDRFAVSYSRRALINQQSKGGVEGRRIAKAPFLGQ
eukprot:scaffold2790_cov239-Pinguiococcus_pyrenoidosus.AAC.14